MTMWKAGYDATGKIVKRVLPSQVDSHNWQGLTQIDYNDAVHDDRFWKVVGGVMTRDSAAELRLAASAVSNDQQVMTAQRFSAGLIVCAVTGQFYDNSFYPAGTSTLPGVTNTIDIAPWTSSCPMVIDQIGVAVATAVAGTSVKVVVYEADDKGWPGARVYESAAIPTIATGFQFVTVANFAFKPGTSYWIGVRYNGAPVIRAIPIANCIALGLNGSNGTNYFTKIRRTLAFATAAPATWEFVPSELIANLMVPSVRFRAA